MSDTQNADLIRSLMAAQAWEDAKGKLRALSAIQGHARLTASPDATEVLSKRWQHLEQVIEGFINDVDDSELANF